MPSPCLLGNRLVTSGRGTRLASLSNLPTRGLPGNRRRESAARNCARQSPEENPREQGSRPTALVVGGGWSGFGAAWQLLRLGFEVQLLDASDSPGGLSAGWRTASGRAVEVGIKGFW